MSKDFYKILDISRSASADEIKKAFRKKAQEFHPDKQGGDESRFKEVNEAYNVLRDEKKRAQYDQFGQAGPGMGGGQQGFGGFDFNGFQGGQMEFDMNDVFGQFFGGGRGRNNIRRGADVSVELRMSFAEAVFGAEKEFTITLDKECTNCGGSGDADKRPTTCRTCNGDGRVVEIQQTIMGPVQRQTVCTDCNGIGRVPNKACGTCKGRGIDRGAEEIKLKVPAGIEDGQQLRMSGRGEYMQGGEAGDLYILVRVEPSRRFEKIGTDIKTSLEVSISEAVLGAEKKVQTVDGDKTIKIPAGTQYASLLRLKGEGVGPKDGRRGDLYVEIIISIPHKLSRAEKKLYEELSQL